jgi:hypothetical protein
VFIRYAFIIYFCEHWFVLRTAIFQPVDHFHNQIYTYNSTRLHHAYSSNYPPQTTSESNELLNQQTNLRQILTVNKKYIFETPSLLQTLYFVTITELFIMDVVLLFKLLVRLILA